jgi:hypothetical protein
MEGLGEETITTFTQAVKRTFDIAMAKLPAELHGHLERAHALVLHRHVFPTDDGRHAQVLSSDGERWYPVNGHCTCMDAPRAPQGLCKHRLAFGLYRRASELLATSACSGGVTAAAAALPEAPASVNVRLCIGGADVQWTLRDADEDRLAERLERLLARFPQQAKPPKSDASAATQQSTAQTPASAPICPVHGPMKESSKAPGTWFCSKKLFNGSYCTEKWPVGR